MPTALLIANAVVRDGAEPIAALPVAGGTLMEAAARHAAAAGADRLIIYADRITPALDAAIVRLARDGLAVDHAADAHALVGLLDADDDVLLIADGIFAHRDTLDAIVAADESAVLAIADTPANAAWERIDATRRWAGVACGPAALVRETAARLGEWDLAATLLRRALQQGAAIRPSLGGGLLALVTDAADAAALDRALGERAADVPRGLADRALLLPVARLATPYAMRSGVAPATLAAAAAAMAAAAVPVAGLVAGAGGVALALLSGVVAAIARRAALISWRPRAIERAERLRVAALALAVVALAARVSAGGGDAAAPALAGGLLVFLALDAEQCRLFAVRDRRPLWAAEPDGLAWTLLPFALAGWWRLGLLALALHALAGLIVIQRRSANRG